MAGRAPRPLPVPKVTIRSATLAVTTVSTTTATTTTVTTTTTRPLPARPKKGGKKISTGPGTSRSQDAGVRSFPARTAGEIDALATGLTARAGTSSTTAGEATGSRSRTDTPKFAVGRDRGNQPRRNSLPMNVEFVVRELFQTPNPNYRPINVQAFHLTSQDIPQRAGGDSSIETEYMDIPSPPRTRPPKHRLDSDEDPEEKQQARRMAVGDTPPTGVDQPLANSTLSPVTNISHPSILPIPHSAHSIAVPAIEGNSFADKARSPVSHTTGAVGGQPAALASRKDKIPPFEVDELPNFLVHLQAIQKQLGFRPNARPLRKGMRFLPATTHEYRIVQNYFSEIVKTDPTVKLGHTYSLKSERPHKVAVRGLPYEIPSGALIAELESITGIKPTHTRPIPPRKGRGRTTHYVQFPHLPRDALDRLYKTNFLLLLPVEVREWHKVGGLPQCHRCQRFGHASVNCFRDIRCVRCAGNHPASECDRENNALKCSNCGRPHASNDYRCPDYKSEARRRGVSLQPPAPVRAAASAGGVVVPPPAAHSEPTQAVSLMAPANGPTPRGAALPNRKRKKKKKKSGQGEGGPVAGAEEVVAVGAAKDATASRPSKPTRDPTKAVLASRSAPADTATSFIPAIKLPTRLEGVGLGGGYSYRREPGGRSTRSGMDEVTQLQSTLISVATMLLQAISNREDLTTAAIQAAASLTQLASSI